MVMKRSLVGIERQLFVRHQFLTGIQKNLTRTILMQQTQGRTHRAVQMRQDPSHTSSLQPRAHGNRLATVPFLSSSHGLRRRGWNGVTIRRALVLEEQTCYSGHSDSFNIMHISNYKETPEVLFCSLPPPEFQLSFISALESGCACNYEPF